MTIGAWRASLCGFVDAQAGEEPKSNDHRRLGVLFPKAPYGVVDCHDFFKILFGRQIRDADGGPTAIATPRRMRLFLMADR